MNIDYKEPEYIFPTKALRWAKNIGLGMCIGVALVLALDLISYYTLVVK